MKLGAIGLSVYSQPEIAVREASDCLLRLSSRWERPSARSAVIGPVLAANSMRAVFLLPAFREGDVHSLSPPMDSVWRRLQAIRVMACSTAAQWSRSS